MKTRQLVPPLLMALAVSGVCTLALSKKLTNHTVVPVATVHYFAPVQSLQAGTVLKTENVQSISWPAASPLAGAFTTAESLVGRALLYPVDANQPLTETMVSSPGAGIGLAGRIPDGMRAIALRSDAVMGVAGFLMPGSHLDVLVTYRTEKNPDPVTITVLQNAVVIAAGQQVQPDPQGKPVATDVVTLLLSPGDAERAVLASTQGTIHFILRSGSDQGHSTSDGVTLAQLSDPALPRPQAQEAAVPQGTIPKPSIPRPSVGATPTPAHQSMVETISGDKQVTATFDEAGK